MAGCNTLVVVDNDACVSDEKTNSCEETMDTCTDSSHIEHARTQDYKAHCTVNKTFFLQKSCVSANSSLEKCLESSSGVWNGDDSALGTSQMSCDSKDGAKELFSFTDSCSSSPADDEVAGIMSQNGVLFSGAALAERVSVGISDRIALLTFGGAVPDPEELIASDTQFGTDFGSNDCTSNSYLAYTSPVPSYVKYPSNTCYSYGSVLIPYTEQNLSSRLPCMIEPTHSIQRMSTVTTAGNVTLASDAARVCYFPSPQSTLPINSGTGKEGGQQIKHGSNSNASDGFVASSMGKPYRWTSQEEMFGSRLETYETKRDNTAMPCAQLTHVHRRYSLPTHQVFTAHRNNIGSYNSFAKKSLPQKHRRNNHIVDNKHPRSWSNIAIVPDSKQSEKHGENKTVNAFSLGNKRQRSFSFSASSSAPFQGFVESPKSHSSSALVERNLPPRPAPGYRTRRNTLSYLTEYEDNSLARRSVQRSDIEYRRRSVCGASRVSHSRCPKVGKQCPVQVPTPRPVVKQYNLYQRLDLPPGYLGKPQLLSTKPNASRSIEGVWRTHMSLLFHNLRETWLLSRIPSTFTPDGSWSSYRDLAKVRFHCDTCNDGWTSMYGVVVFHYRRNPLTPQQHRRFRHTLQQQTCFDTNTQGWGEILFEVAGQMCSRCRPNKYEMPLWYAEEAQKVITNLYYEVGRNLYGLHTPTPIRTRRLGKPNAFHPALLCQGCESGLCKQHLRQDWSGHAAAEDLSVTKSCVTAPAARATTASVDGGGELNLRSYPDPGVLFGSSPEHTGQNTVVHPSKCDLSMPFYNGMNCFVEAPHSLLAPSVLMCCNYSGSSVCPFYIPNNAVYSSSVPFAMTYSYPVPYDVCDMPVGFVGGEQLLAFPPFG